MMAITKEKIKKWEEKGKVKKLIKALKDIDIYIRRSAAAALGEIGDPKAVDPLIEALKDKGNLVRDSTVNALGKIGDPKVVDPLIEALKDRDYGVRRSALKALDKIGDAKAVAPIIEALGDKQDVIRGEAAMALGNFKDPKVVEPLIETLGDNDYKVRFAALMSLGKIGDKKAVERISRMLLEERGEPHICKEIARTLTTLGWEPTNDEIGARYHIAEGKLDKCVDIGDPAVRPLIAQMKYKAPRHDSIGSAFLGKAFGKLSNRSAGRQLARKESSAAVKAAEALKSIYQSGNISPENKKELLKLKESKLKISDWHIDQKNYDPDNCKFEDHSDKMEDIYFDL
ncbi:MAG: HEAT repeat domain-containing protein [Candidatus Aminicenantes bacterium]|jgi:hypothetical protein